MQALTTLSPILPDRVRQLNSRLRVVRYTPGLGRPLLQLGFIHYARWIIVDGLPDGRGGWRGLRWKYLLFESNYDGDQVDYLRTFADIIPARLIKLWGACFGFDTMTRPPHGTSGNPLVPFGFRSYVELNQLKVLAFFAAYPDASAIDVLQAITIHDMVSDAKRAAVDQEVLEQTAAASVALALGPGSPGLSLPQRVRSVYTPWLRSVSGHYGVNPITIITPLDDDKAAELCEACRDRGILDELAQTQTHFARLVFVPRLLSDVGQPDPDALETAYLLLTSDVWGPTYDYIEAWRTTLRQTADLIWGNCEGYPGTASTARFHAWIDAHMLRTRYYVAGYPPHPVEVIKRRLRERADVAEQFVEEGHPSAAELLTELHEADD